MIQFDPGNVIVKPSHRRQFMAWLRRANKLGQRVGRFAMSVTIRRIGRVYEAIAKVRDAAGEFVCRCREHDFLDALHSLAGQVAVRVHAQRVTVLRSA